MTDSTLREWECRQQAAGSMLRHALVCLEARIAQASGVEVREVLRDLYPVDADARFRWRAGELERVRQFVRETGARLDSLLSSLRGEDGRPPMHLVVDNTRPVQP